jgi:uncharacterized membrane protein
MQVIPEKVKKVISEAPLAWGLIALLDYRRKYKTAHQIKKEWDKAKNTNTMQKQILENRINFLGKLIRSRTYYINQRNYLPNWSDSDEGIAFIEETNRLMEEKYQKEVQLEKLQSQKA